MLPLKTSKILPKCQIFKKLKTKFLKQDSLIDHKIKKEWVKFGRWH